MRFWRTLPGAGVLVLAIGLTSALAGIAVQVHRTTHPDRQADDLEEIASLVFLRVEDVRFESTDGIPLAGWLFRGEADAPAVILCHDLGASRGSLLNLAIALQGEGLNVLAFDFRGHGASGGSGSTLGIFEKRDVLGALAYLESLPGIDTRRAGIYGVGQGAHAAVLAAADRSTLRVLVLDGLYPDARWPLVRKTYTGWRFGVRNLQAPPAWTFDVMNGVRTGRWRAADVLPGLHGRELLLIAPAGDVSLSHEIEAMYATIPHGESTEGNLVTLPATLTEGLGGDGTERYLERVRSFFGGRLSRS